MKISPSWVREFVDLKVDDQQLAEALTMHGTSVEGIEKTGAGAVYEVEFTSNRPDAMNHYGVARECAAIFDVDLKPIGCPILSEAKGGEVAAPFNIEIEDAKGCARYTARVIRGVKIGPSPELIVRRLQSVEQRSISNVADASNYTLWEIGQPTHAFDLDTLEGGKIIVRRARDGETLKTLDGVERKLSKEDLVIADARKPVALAGVMGGFETMITEKTRNVLIESAWFDPSSIRKTARRHSLHTDASHRYERGADYGITQFACARVAQFVLESAGGKLEGGEIDVIARQVEPPVVHLRQSEVTRLLGKDIAADEIARILRRLGFGVSGAPGKQESSAGLLPGGPCQCKGSSFAVQVPTWRLDVSREIDVIEEIARIYGYDNFENTLPEASGAVIELPDERKDAHMRETLLAEGYHQAMSWTFVGSEEAQKFTAGEVVNLENPISDEAAVMRTSLLPGMLQMLAWNLNRGNNDVRLFEEGHVFERVGDKVDERKRISLGATGNSDAGTWDRKPRAYSFFDMKGDIESLLSAFEHRALYFDEHAPEYFHPGRSARAVMDGETVARFGQLHPDMAAARKIKQDVYVGEVYLDRLYQHKLREPHYTPIPRYPAVDRDFSFVFANAVTFERIQDAVASLHLAELKGFAPVEVFRGGAVPEGKYSVLLRAEFQSAERTLRDEDVAQWAQGIVKKLEGLGGTMRA